MAERRRSYKHARPPGRKGKPTGGGRLEEGSVRGLGHGGDAAVETGQGVVFVPGALPGERVRFRSLGKRRGVGRGELVEVLTPAPTRVEPPCRYQARCGGCPWMVWSPQAQREQKRVWVAEAASVAAVDPGGGEPTLAVGMTVGPSELSYRRRARLSFAANAHPRLLGYRRRGEKRVLDVALCAVLSEPLQAALERLRAVALPELAGAGELELGTGAGGKALARLAVAGVQPPALYAALRQLAEEEAFSGLVLSLEQGATEEHFGDTREWVQALDGDDLWGAPGGFTQANGAVNRALVAWVTEAAEVDGLHVLELYAGHGNFTVELARTAASVRAIEQHPAQARYCADNVRARGLAGVKVVAADVHPLPAMSGIDVVVLDPPRTGAREVLDEVLALRPKRIVYVSCDPPTLARDLRVLHAGGYVADRAQAFDMFPHTSHVEAAVRLRRAT